MATNLERTVSIIFRGDDRVGKALSSVNKQMGGLASMAESVAAPLSRAADLVLKVDAVLAAMAAGGLALALKTSGEFSDQFGEIVTLFDAPADSIDRFRTEILGYSRDSTQAIDQVNAAIYTAISAGTDYANSLDVLNQAEQLSVVGRSDLEATTRLLVSTLNAYGAETAEAQKYSDIFFKTVQLGQTTIPELAASLSQVTGIAASADVPIETLTAAIAALTAKGVPTSQAVTAIRGALSALLKPSKEASELAGELGIEFGVAALESKGFEGILKDVYKATGGNAEQMAVLFGRIEGLNAVLQLGSDDFKTLDSAMSGMADSTGIVAAKYEDMVDAFENVNQRLANNVRVTLIQLGDELGTNYADVVNEISSIFESLGFAIDAGAFDELFNAFDGFTQKLSEYLADVAEALPEALENVDWDPLIESLGELGEVVADFFDTDFRDPEQLSDAIQGVVNTLTGLTDVTRGMLQAFQPYFDAIKEAISGTGDLEKETREKFGEILTHAKAITTFGAQTIAVFHLMEQAGFDWAKTFQAVFGMVGTAVGALQYAFLSMEKIYIEVYKGLLSASQWLADNLPFGDAFAKDTTKVQEQLKIMEGIVDADLKKIEEKLGKSWDILSDAFDSADQSAQKASDSTTKAADTASLYEKNLKAVNAAMAESQKETGKASATTKELGNAATETNEKLKALEEPKKAAIDTESAAKSLEQLDKESERRHERILESIEWTAKLDIAEVEAEATKFEALMDSMGESAKAAAGSASDMFGSLAGVIGDLGYSDQSELIHLINDELDIQRDIAESQIEMNEAYKDYIEAKKDALERGDAVIQVDGTGLAPELEMIMWKILEMVQVRASEEVQDFLLGLD